MRQSVRRITIWILAVKESRAFYSCMLTSTNSDLSTLHDTSGQPITVLFSFKGYKMYFTLTRHTFGNLQSQLFPVYFTVGSCLSTVALVTYYLMHPVEVWTGDEKLQVNENDVC